MKVPVAVVCAALLAACGAKTGLRVPDVPAVDDRPDVADFDAPDAADAPDVGDACRPTVLPVERFAAEVIFVIDRSGSMNDRVTPERTRWQELTAALADVLPAVDRELWTGLVQYPTTRAGTANACGLSPDVEIAPRPGNAANILAALRRSNPVGGTPTHDALNVAAGYYDRTPMFGRIRGRFFVLATDGGPNCNGAIPRSECVCTNRVGCVGPQGALSCLDDARTTSLLRSLNARGLATFVIGVPGAESNLEATLDAMALAGGRARSASLGGERYYRAGDAASFTRAFREITTALSRCRFVTNPLRDPSEARVVVDGRAVPFDPSREDGWDWERVETGEFALFGPTCAALQGAPGVVRVETGCGD